MWRLIAAELGLMAYGCAWAYVGRWIADWFARHPKGIRVRIQW